MDLHDVVLTKKLLEGYIQQNTAGDAYALATLAECEIITPAVQDGVIYTDTDGTVFVI